MCPDDKNVVYAKFGPNRDGSHLPSLYRVSREKVYEEGKLISTNYYARNGALRKNPLLARLFPDF
jgi:hypothetical protein